MRNSIHIARRWRILETRNSTVLSLAILAITLAGASAMRSAFSPVQEMAKVDLGLSDFQISLVQGLAASIPIALLSIPIGRLADRVQRVRLLIAMAIIWTIGTALTGLAHGFGVLFAARMLAGLGAIALPVAISLAADLSSPERRGRAILALSVGVYVGGAAAFAIGGWLTGGLAAGGWSWVSAVRIQSWRAVHLLLGVASAISVLPLLWLREPARQELGAAPDAALRPVLHELWARRRVLAPLFVGQVSVMMADTAATIWASPVLIRDHGLTPAQFGGWMGIVVLLPGIVGTVVGGYMADLGQRLKFRGGILSGAVVACVVSIPAALFPVMSSVEGFAVMLAILLLCGAVTGLVTATAITVLVPNELRGLCLGALIVLSSIVAFAMAPTFVTMLSSALGGEAYLARSLALIGAVVGAASLVAFLVAMTRMPHSTAIEH